MRSITLLPFSLSLLPQSLPVPGQYRHLEGITRHRSPSRWSLPHSQNHSVSLFTERHRGTAGLSVIQVKRPMHASPGVHTCGQLIHATEDAEADIFPANISSHHLRARRG